MGWRQSTIAARAATCVRVSQSVIAPARSFMALLVRRLRRCCSRVLVGLSACGGVRACAWAPSCHLAHTSQPATCSLTTTAKERGNPLNPPRWHRPVPPWIPTIHATTGTRVVPHSTQATRDTTPHDYGTRVLYLGLHNPKTASAKSTLVQVPVGCRPGLCIFRLGRREA